MDLKHFPLFALLGAATLLSACGDIYHDLDRDEVRSYTKEWLHGESGQTLTFRSEIGFTRQVTITRRDEVVSVGGGKTLPSDEQHITLFFRNAPDSVLNFTMQAINTEITFTRIEAQGPTARVHTREKSALEAIESLLPAAKLYRDTVMAGRTYRLLAHVPVRVAANPTDTLTAIYYDKYEGLVAYKTTRGRTWFRQ